MATASTPDETRDELVKELEKAHEKLASDPATAAYLINRVKQSIANPSLPLTASQRSEGIRFQMLLDLIGKPFSDQESMNSVMESWVRASINVLSGATDDKGDEPSSGSS